MYSSRKTASLLLGAAVSTAWGQTLTADMISSMGNNSLFTRWRPYSHFLAPAGWMNDPCGPLYDPVGGLYHMHYQWHPNHVNWGNVSWGHATSSDLITWTDVDHFPKNNLSAWQGLEAQSIGTTNISANHTPPLYNHLGIWSGTAQPVNISGEMDGTLLAFYTSVSYLPTGWDAPYTKGTESQSLAYSYDGGITWEQYPGNPILSEPPGGWNITGWRDPFFHPSPELDGMLNLSEPHYYAVFGSGIKDVGPRMPLYIAPASNLTNWTFLGALWEPKENTSLGTLLETGTYGFNFEVSNFFSIDDHWFVAMGIQGAPISYHEQEWVLWNEGNLSVRQNGSIAFEPISGGVADWGLLYAITSFNDTKNNRRIQYGWAWEDMNNFAITQQGFQGTLALPRELFIKETTGVVHNDSDTQIGNSRYIKNSNGTWTASTLGLRPVPEVVEALRENATHSYYDSSSISLDNGPVALEGDFSHSYEVKVVIGSTTGIVGVTIAASPGREEYTNIYYDPSNYTVVCERAHSSLITEFLNSSYTGYFKPYEMGNSASNSTTESISMDIFLDGSLVEIFINDRFALTSRIYPSREDSTGIGLYAANGTNVTFLDVEVWDGLLNVWPDRPLNSSSLLVQDTPAETDNGTWWQGN